MQVAIITVGDEILAGDTENTNASWLGRQVTERGATVARVLVVPDDTAVIADYVRRWVDEFDAVVVTGGLGGTHDDVTMRAVADAFDRGLVVDPDVLDEVTATANAFAERNPDLTDAYDLDLDLEAWAEIPEGARPLDNAAGLAPGCVLDGVYVLPGVPEEMRATFEPVADEFGGDAVSETLYTPMPEGALSGTLADLPERFDVALGSYPAPTGTPGRVKVTGSDPDDVAAAVTWLSERLETVEEPGERA
ncbi:competence/damage-inducible protein A [Candidatus Halobonum tyrrellensis]|uniref:Molybdopterin binding domain protein n=1 Tax=Candidatus Halobonum tyrrellensis G22 TaxID=1324957 RepID=V4GWR4_9EURY|nr:molybdopterin-binding protein [Candidatus Halobonum tyrrellensis]ESP89621.1 molybdopterin binding domain protein [Candidatus Halobonum tyrrellensis G22]